MPLIQDARAREPEARVPAYILRSAEFAALVKASPLAVHLLLLLWAHADVSDHAWCSQRRLAALAGTKRRTALECLALMKRAEWILSFRRTRDTGERAADGYVLRSPGLVEVARNAVNERLAGRAVEGEIPYFVEGDVFFARSEIRTRKAFVPLSVLSSRQWCELRASGQAMHLYLLLLCYGPDRERVSGRRLAEETHLPLVRIREAVAHLSHPHHAWIEVERNQTLGGKTLTSSYKILGRLYSPVAIAEPTTGATDVGEVYGQGPVPADLFEQLSRDVRRMIDQRHEEGPERWSAQWEALRDVGLWPRPNPEDRDTAVLRFIRQFHHEIRGTDTTGYEPSEGETRYVAGLFDELGEHTWEVGSYCIREMKRTHFAAGNVQAMKGLVGEAVQALGLAAAK